MFEKGRSLTLALVCALLVISPVVSAHTHWQSSDSSNPDYCSACVLSVNSVAEEVSSDDGFEGPSVAEHAETENESATSVRAYTPRTPRGPPTA